MNSFAYDLAWAILVIQATLVLFLLMYVVGFVVGFVQFLWQEYVSSKISRAWRRLMVVVITRLIKMHNIAHNELYKKDKPLMLHQDTHLERLHKGPGAIPPSNAPNLNGVLRQ